MSKPNVKTKCWRQHQEWFEIDFAAIINYSGNDKAVFDLNNGTNRIVINLERDADGNLYTITEWEGYTAQTINTVTITNGATHRLSLDVTGADFSFSLNGELV